ncbi:MAG: insulinase family protein [Deltaproteobacteria bacterium]|nr:insulinase family protein [Deltaproteobacteria bacterium]
MKYSLLFALTMVLALGTLRQANGGPSKADIKLERWALPNGLQVIFVPHHRIPIASVQVWYHVGSKNERRGIRGVAHMFEHMMFKGSRRVRPEAHAELLSALGGSVNAFTTQDVTAYHNTLPKQYFKLALQLEAERMRSLMISNKMLKSEREVVKEEKRQRMENDPIGRAFEAIHELAYKKHPYAWTPAGDIGDLDRSKLETYQRFYERYYQPNNATLVVAGDLKRGEVQKAVKHFFGGLSGGPKTPGVSIVEPPQKKQRLLRADWNSQLNVVLGVYHIPSARSPDISALRVLSTILSAGRSSRLHRAMVRKQKIALGAGGFTRQLEHPGLFFVYAVGLPQHNVDTLNTALLAEIEKVREKGVTQKELSKAKNQLATSHLRGLATVEGIAYQVGQAALVRGNPMAFINDALALDKVTNADIKRVAARYLSPTNLSLVLVPAGKSKGGAK